MTGGSGGYHDSKSDATSPVRQLGHAGLLAKSGPSGRQTNDPPDFKKVETLPSKTGSSDRCQEKPVMYDEDKREEEKWQDEN